MQVTCTQMERSAICLCSGERKGECGREGSEGCHFLRDQLSGLIFHRSPGGEQSKSKSQRVIGEI